MKKIIYPGAFIALAAVVAAFQFTSSPKHTSKPTLRVAQSKTKPAEANSAVQVKSVPDADFDFNLFHEVAKENSYGNTVVSPVTTYMGLSMIYNGAIGRTKDALAKALGADGMSLEKFNSGNKKILDAFAPGLFQNLQLNMASSIWIEQGYPVNADFINTNRKYYSAEVESLNLHDPSAVNAVNDWVRRKTKGKIGNLIDRFGEYDRVVVINTVYFSGKWKSEFDPKDTHRQQFTLADGKKVLVDMMAQEDEFAYTKGDGFQSVTLPYGDDAEMVVILPDKGRGNMESVIGRMGGSIMENITSHSQPCIVRLKLPKFKMDCMMELNESLKALGLSSMFHRRAGFLGVSPSPDLCVSRVVQRAIVKVDEEGTEATAANEKMYADGESAEMEHVDFVVDRPFIFVIRAHGKTLFTGLVADPRK